MRTMSVIIGALSAVFILPLIINHGMIDVLTSFGYIRGTIGEHPFNVAAVTILAVFIQTAPLGPAHQTFRAEFEKGYVPSAVLAIRNSLIAFAAGVGMMGALAGFLAIWLPINYRLHMQGIL
jgi:hypothetical protein